MKCPKCGTEISKVVATYNCKKWRTRRRECLECGERFTTKEVVVEKEDR